jgi:hypothetical protein
LITLIARALSSPPEYIATAVRVVTENLSLINIALNRLLKNCN